jgi:hypothetical protein
MLKRRLISQAQSENFKLKKAQFKRTSVSLKIRVRRVVLRGESDFLDFLVTF